MADQHFAGLFSRLVVELLERAGQLERVLAEIGETRPLSVLKDDAQWHSYDQVRCLYEGAARALGGADELFRAGGDSTALMSNQAELSVMLQDLGGLRGIWQTMADGS